MDKLQKMLEGLDLRAMTGIEIGALTSPLVSRAAGEIIYVDHADTETLRRKYAGDANVDVSRIVEVDAVWGSNTLQQAIGEGRKVDYVIASHVVEHVPDLLGWLAEIQGVLRPAGTLRLAVPDRRFTFDFLRQETRLSDILNARLAAARAPLPAQILDCVSEIVTLDAAAAWRGEVDRTDGPPRMHSVAQAVAAAEDALRNGSYHDVHCWVFTPGSFARLLGRAAAQGLHGFACVDSYDTEPGELEFQVILQPCADREAAAASWERMARAMREDVPGSVDAELKRLHREGASARQRLAEAAHQVETAQQRLAETTADAAALRAGVSAAQRRVAELEASTSWRITGPLRALARSLRRV